jgi:CRP-like cAMP-binding protein
MTTSSSENRLLAALPAADLSRLIARMEDIHFSHKEIVYSNDGPLEFVYFPRSGLLSAVVMMADGQSAETAAIGREGMVGVATFLGATRSAEQVFCQIYPAVCRKFPVGEFLTEIAKEGALHDIIQRYTRAALVASARQTACNALHSVQERCARWLLLCHDAAGVDEFSLTQEFLATMLGVRRATVTETAVAFQSAGIITYRHGKLKILKHEELENVACECYLAIRKAFEFAQEQAPPV